MMTYENIKSFCEKFNQIIDNVLNGSDDDDMWLQLWETMYAIAVIKDIGDINCARRIGDRLIAICDEYCEEY